MCVCVRERESVCVCARVRVYVYVCVRLHNAIHFGPVCACVRVCVYVCTHVCVRMFVRVSLRCRVFWLCLKTHVTCLDEGRVVILLYACVCLRVCVLLYG